ncbi:MAG: HlyD family secretion protein [Polyangiaceae bacterium]
MATLAHRAHLPEDTTSPTAAAETPKRSRAKVVLPVLVLLAALGGGASYYAGLGHEATDDAQVEGHVGSVAARVSGQVVKVRVADNQEVKVGDVLVELDDRDYQVRRLAAKADLEAARAALRAAETQTAVTLKSVDSNLAVARGGLAQAAALGSTSQAAITQSKADVTAAEARQRLAQSEFDRAQKLFSDGAISKAELDARKSAFDQQDAALAQAQARLTSALAGTANSSGTLESARGRLIAAQAGPEQIEAAKAQVALAQARVDQASAALEQAELNIQYTKVKAEVAGTVARRSVEPGQLVSPDRPMMAIVPLTDTWVVANFKEDQLADMKPGQPVKIKVDTYGSRVFTGRVDSIAPGTGSRFSLLPPDNASGNFTKVVQRVPVLIKLDEREGQGGPVLRPGMSATVNVTTK